MMSLRDKTLITVGLTVLLVTAVIYVISRLILLGSYVQLEEQFARQNVNRASRSIDEALDVIDAINQDWASWSEVYRLTQGADAAAFVRDELAHQTFGRLRLNFVVITDRNGRPIYSHGYDFDTGKRLPIPASLIDQITPGSPLLPLSGAEAFSKGILMLPENPVLLSARPIYRAEQPTPASGVIILGRYLTREELQRMAMVTGFSFSIQRLDRPPGASDSAEILAGLSEQEALVLARPISSEQIGGYKLIDDLYGRPALLLTLTMPRSIYQQGRSSLSYFMFLLFSVGGIFSLITIRLLERQILSRLASLTKRVLAIGESRDFSERISLPGDDELSTLAGSINDMLRRLQQATEALRVSEDRFRKLAETSAAIIFIHQNGRFRYINQMGIASFGYNSDQLLNMGFNDLISLELRAEAGSLLRLLEEGNATHVRFETKIDTGVGDERYLEITATPFEYEGWQAAIGTAYDITERKLAEEQLIYLSNHDALSGLYNRVFFEEELNRLERGREFPMSMVIIDIDELKWANDTLGHAAGDELIRRTAGVLREVFRAEDVVARIGGDEFAVLLPGVNRKEAAETKKRLRERLALHNKNYPDLPLRFSVGIATGQVAGPLTALMQEADALMYREKMSKRSHYEEHAGYHG